MKMNFCQYFKIIFCDISSFIFNPVFSPVPFIFSYWIFVLCQLLDRVRLRNSNNARRQIFLTYYVRCDVRLCLVWREIMSGVTWDYVRCYMIFCPVRREIMSGVTWDYVRCYMIFCPVWRVTCPGGKTFSELLLLSLDIGL